MAGNPGYFSNHSQTRLTTPSGTNTSSSPVSTPTTSGPNGHSLAGPNSRSRSASGAAQSSAVRSKHFSLSVTGNEKPSSEKGRGNSTDRTGNGGGLPAVHPLKSTWVIWFHQRQNRTPQTLINYEEGIKRVTSFSSVESFWSIFTHLNPPSNVQPTTDYLVFHSGVQRPVWEDPMNVKGGKWSIRLRKGVADRLWEDLILALIGDQFEDEDEVCGCVLSVRIQEDIISIWNKDESNSQVLNRIRETARRVLNLPASTVFEYKSHNDSLQDKSSFRKLPAANDRVIIVFDQRLSEMERLVPERFARLRIDKKRHPNTSYKSTRMEQERLLTANPSYTVMNAQEPIQPELRRSNSVSSSVKSGKLADPVPAPDASAEPTAERHEVRPPLDYSSFGAFWASVGARLRSIMTRRFVYALLGGQLVSICITCTSVATTELVNRGWSLPTTQTWFLYFALFSVYTPYTIHKYGFKGWGNVVIKDGWRYFILAACDVEGNFLVVKAYAYTNMISCMLLNSWAIPVCAFLAWIYMRPKYHWTQIIGILVCIGGMGMLIASDYLTGTNQWPAASMLKGDLFMLAGATLYGFTNATEEFFVRKRPLYEVVGQLGMYGMIINAIQASSLEHDDMRRATWNGGVIGLLFAYTIAMFILYTTAPLIYRAASSVYYNLSLLSSNFYGLLFGLGLYHYRPYWLYFVAFAVIIGGLISYFWHSTPEEQGKLDPQAPEYVNKQRVNETNV